MDLLLDDDAIPKDENDSNSNKMISLRIRTNNESTVYSLSIEQSRSVLQLKESVRNKLGPAARGRYLRLVCQGRLLAPDRSKIVDFQLKQNSVVHAVLAAPGVRGGQQAALSQGSSSSRRRFRGIGIGADGLVIPRNNNSSSASDSDDSDVEEGRAGFDRLRDNGMSRSEVEVIRAYFSRQVDRFREQQQSRSNNNETENTETTEVNNDTSNNSTSPNNSNYDENTNRGQINSSSSTSADIRRERLQWEDQWMEAQGPSTEFRLNLNTNNPLLATRVFGNAFDFAASAAARSSLGTDRDFGWGFFLGFFMGFVMMFWVWMPTVPHKQKLGILTGICFQMTLNMLRNRSFDDLEE